MSSQKELKLKSIDHQTIQQSQDSLQIKPILLQKSNIKAAITVDFSAATIASFAVSPFITIIDKAVVQAANGSCPLWKAVKIGCIDLITKPVQFFRRAEFYWIWQVYLSTYITANVTESICLNKDINPQFPKFITVFIANAISSIIKDKKLAVMFGVIEQQKFPIKSYCSFALRDMIAMGFVFNLPSVAGAWINRSFQIEQVMANTIAQLISPIACQIFCTPLHLLGLDFYNNQQNTVIQRIQFLKILVPKTIVLRSIRIFPAYGIGGVGNTFLKRYFTNWAKNDGY